MISIIAPNNFVSEREYIYDVVFRDFLGIEYELNFSAEATRLTIIGLNGTIYCDDSFFLSIKETAYTEACLPKIPLQEIIIDNKYPEVYKGVFSVLFGKRNSKEEFLNISGQDVFLGVDIFGSAFFMLTRLEEYVVNDRDEHDRFPVEASIAYKAGFLDRPIINEYVEILWSLLQKIDDSLARKERKYQVIPTHDIDKPFGMLFDTTLQIARHFAGDLVYRKSVKALISRMGEVIKAKFTPKQYIAEKSETFNFMLEESCKHDLNDIFFFMNSKKSWHDGNYEVSEKPVIELIAKLISKGCIIGLHPSFVSYLDGAEIKREADSMNKVLSVAGLPALKGARQHYLKWKNPDTWQHYEDAGISFDSSMTYAGQVGFRTGVCYPYPVFNLETRKELNMIERPLIVMDGTLYEYMGLSHEAALPVIRKLADECRKYNGEFVILWHNTMLDNIDERNFYSKMLNEVCRD